MERLLIILAVLVCVVAGTAVIAISARSRRPPLRMDNEFEMDDERLVLGPVGASDSPIDRSAPLLEARVPDPDRIAGPRPPEESRQLQGPNPGRTDGAR